MKASVLFLCVLLVALAAGLPTATTAQTTYTATDDGYIRGGALAGNTYNASDKEALRVRYATADTNKRRTYLKFDLSSHVGIIGSAKLTVWVSRAVSSTYNTITNPNLFADSVFVYSTGDTWTEATLTWNSAPAMEQFLFLQAVKRKSSTDPDTMYSWDVTSYVQAEFAKDKKVSFAMADTVVGHGTDLRMYSKETFGFEPALVISATTDVTALGGVLPDRFELQQNYPNPFNPTTTIGFSIPSRSSSALGAGTGAASLTTLKVYDLLGREVQTLVNEPLSPGTYSVPLSASKLGSGTYFYTLTARNYRETKRMVVLK